ncbi:MAG: cation-transporting P-type ATPase [Xanthomonadales bacterium]|nr:cation-transporting P-type ATPase [Xanthomonadales bacterium]
MFEGHIFDMGKLASSENLHALEPDRFVEESHSDPEQGLSQAEATERLEQMGPNKPEERTENPFGRSFSINLPPR